ncbi:hypothetical protein EDD11_009690 [Mortierella claussenii]|nr:hypothetical protein EDD11_009690 [Mortierella claussenii]
MAKSASILMTCEENTETPTSKKTSSAVYDTADDGDFISTDRRRRRKAKGTKGVSATNSSESLVKPATSSNREQDSSSGVTNPIAPLPSPSISSVQLSEPSPPAAQRENCPRKRQQTYQQQGTAMTERHRTHQQPDTKAAKVNVVETAVTTAEKSKHKKPTPVHDSTFVHPLHALNSTSSIVRLKHSHKRSQSAQLPPSSPWNVPQVTFDGKQNQGSTLNQTSQSETPISPTNTSITGSLSVPASIKSGHSDSTAQTQTGAGSAETRPFKDYDLFGQSSIWYSPFQSGLDISIESDEQGNHNPQLLSKPRIQIDSINAQKLPNVGPVLPSSSFFESSPRTPRIMPFSQHQDNNSLGSEDWSLRARASSIAAPMTPLLEMDYGNPMDYFSGSRSASSSRRGSAENNLTESLLSGRARMFGMSGPTSPMFPRSRDTSVPSVDSAPPISESTFLSPHFSASSMALPSSSVFSSSPASSSPSLRQTVLDSPLSTHAMLSDGVEDSTSTFVNPWESNYPYRSRHTMSETLLPFGPLSTLNSVDHGVDHDRQSSLLRLMNSGRIRGSPSSIDHGDRSLAGMQEQLDEKEAIRRGFLLPSLAHHSHSSVPSSSSSLSSSSADLSSFRPFASVEMSLAAAANQPPPLRDEPAYDFVELKMMGLPRNPTPILKSTPPPSSQRLEAVNNDKRPRDRPRHGKSRSGHHKSASLSSFFPPMPPASSVSESATLGNQATTASALDPLDVMGEAVMGMVAPLGRVAIMEALVATKA